RAAAAASPRVGASRESARSRGQDREGLGPVRRGKPGQRGAGGGRPGGGRGRGAARAQENVEKPRTDEQATSAEGREQPPIEPQVETVDAPVADAPDT